MQTQYGANAEAAIVAAERVLRIRVLVDWNQDGLYEHPLSDISSYVESVDTDRSLDGNAPDEVFLIEGASAAELNLVMSGEYDGQMLSNIFSPYNAKSPFFKKTTVGAEIKYSVIVDSVYGEFVYPQFVGNIRNITPNRADATVTFSALDRSEKLRKPVLFPPFAMDEWWANTNGRVKSQEIDSSWFIDHCLRQCDVSTSPYRPTYREEMGIDYEGMSGTQLWVSGTGSHLPSVGWSTRTYVTQYPPVESLGIEMYGRNGIPHPDAPEPSLRPFSFNSTTSTAGDHRYWCADRDQINPASLHTISFTLLGDGANANWWRSQTQINLAVIYIGGDYSFRIVVGGGQMWTTREKVDTGGSPISGQTITSAKVNIPSGRSAVRCKIVWDLTAQTGSRVFLSADENTVGYNAMGAGLGSNIAELGVLKGFVSIYHGASYQDFCYAVRDTFGLDPAQALLNAGREAMYAATLDGGLQKLSYVPVKRGESAWDVITDVAASEQGAVFWDESGRFRFWNADRIRGLQSTIVRDFTLDDLSQLQITNTLDSVRNIWSVESTKSSSVYGIVYKSSNPDEFYVGSRTDVRVRLSLDGVVAADPSRLQKYSSSAGVSGLAQWNEDRLHGYVMEFFTGGTWQERDDLPSVNVYVRCYYDAAGNLVVRVSNTTGYTIRLTQLHVGGNIVKQYDPTVTVLQDANSVGLYGGRNYKLDGEWIQEGYSTTRVRASLMSRTLEPTPTTDAITVAGDPRVQLGDTVRMTDPDGFGVDLKVQILGIRRRFDLETGLTDEYTVQLLSTELYTPPVEEPNPPAPKRYNLCPNPALKNNTTGWFGPGGSARVTGQTGMVRTTAYSQGGLGMIVGPQGDVKAGETYRFSAYVKGSFGASSGRTNIDWYTKWGWYLGSAPANSWSVTNGGVTRVDTGAHKAPAGAARALIVISQNTPRVVATGVLYEKSSTLGSYFDGDTAGAVWNGTNGNSASTLG